MARIRSVHPGLWTDDAFLGLSKDALLFVIALWSECDDGGAFQWKPRQLKPRLAAASEGIDVDQILAELADANFITRYRVDDADYGAVRSFGKYQKPQKPARQWPMPQRIREYTHTTTLAGKEAEEAALGGGESGSGSDLPEVTAPSGKGNSGSRDRPNARAGTILDGGDTHIVSAEEEYDTPTVPVSSGEEKEKEKEKERRGGEVPPSGDGARAREPATRGRRLPETWLPGMEDREFAIGLGLDPDAVAASFSDHWRAASGQSSSKRDWSAAFRNWCRNEIKFNSRRSNNPQPQQANQVRQQSTRWDRLASVPLEAISPTVAAIMRERRGARTESHGDDLTLEHDELHPAWRPH